MAAGNWIFFNTGKQKALDGTLDMDTDVFRMALIKTLSGRAVGSIFSAISANEISATGGYAAGGKTLSGISLKAGGSAGVRQWSHGDRIFTANGGNLTNIKYAVLLDHSKGGTLASRPIVAYSQLSTSQFTITTGNTLTVKSPTGGAFDISGATT